MKLRNGADGYGVVTKTLHWATVTLLVAQVVVGYLLDWDDDSGRGRGRGRGRGGGSGRGRGGGGEEEEVSLLDALDGLLAVHVAIGVAILLLAITRTLWRATTPLPPWAETLSAGERRAAHHTERVLLALLYVVPLSGIALVLSRDDDLVPLHVASHLLLYAAVAAHLWLVLGHRYRGGGNLLRRMT